MERAHEREYDLLRVICCAAVVVLHTGSIYLAGWQPSMPAANRTAAALMQSLTRDAVPLFVMLSGAFLLPDPKSRDFRQFYRKSWKKMGIPTLVFSALYVAYAYAVLLAKIHIKHTAGTDQLGQPLTMWLNGVPYFHMWFMYMLAGLYAVTPVLASLKQRMEERAWLAAGGFCTLAGMAVVPGILYDGSPYPLPFPEKGRKSSEKRISLRGPSLSGRGCLAVSPQALVRDSAAV